MNNQINNNMINSRKKPPRCILDIESNSFKPYEPHSRLICIGIMDVTSDETKVFQDNNEKAMITNFFTYFNKKQFCQIIGYNVSFDIQFLFSRCLYFQISNKRFFTTPTYDIMWILKNVKGKNGYNHCGSLNDWCKVILGKEKTFQNTEIADLYKKGLITEIVNYNKRDLELEAELLHRIEHVLKS